MSPLCLAACLLLAGAPPALTEPGGLLARAQAALDAKDFEAARALAAQATADPAAGPDRGRAFLCLGLANARLGQWERAQQAFAAAAAIEPRSAVAQFDLGSALFERDQLPEAEAAFRAAATLDPTVAPLATYDAGRAAQRQGQLDAAIALFGAAKGLAALRQQAALAARADEALAAATQQRDAMGKARIQALAQQGRDALHQDQPKAAESAYQAALVEAARLEAPAADRAELRFGLGYAELRAEELAAATADLGEAVRLAPAEAPFHFMLALADTRADRAGDAWAEFQQSLALGLDPAEGLRAEGYLDLLWDRRLDFQRFTFEAHAALGYDTDVPQSGVVVTLASSAPSQIAAPYLEADLDAEWRVFGSSRNGLTLDYRFSQLAYFSGATQLDPYSLQEHDLELDALWSPAAWLTLEALVQPYLQFAGVATFGPFQTGLALGPQVTLREGQGWETDLRYGHTIKASLDPTYDYLSGNRDDLWVTQLLRGRLGRLSAGYRLESERVGVEIAPDSTIFFPCPAGSLHCPPPTGANYVIPYSYLSQEASVGGALYLPWSLRASLDLRYEYRPYDGQSLLQGTGAKAVELYKRSRTDDRYTLEASLRRTFGRHLTAALQYSAYLNTSNIDNANAATALDYENENYLKQVFELSLGTEW